MAYDKDPVFVLAAGAAFPAVSIVVVALRFYVRSTQKARYGPDDWLALAGLVFLIGLGILLIIGVKLGVYGYPTTSSAQSILAAKLEYAFQPMQMITVSFAKLSFIYFYRRIFVTGSSTRNLFGKATIAMAVLIVLWTISFVFAFFFSCGSDITAHWNEKVLRAKCDKGLTAEMGLAVSDFLLDVMVFLLPIPMILRLHMTRGRKIAVLAIFGVGFVALAASFVRMLLFNHLTRLAAGTKEDNDLVITRGLYWGMLESGLAIIACCLPTLHALLLKSSIESVIRSVRSATSLRSISSSRSKKFSQMSGDTEDLKGKNSTASVPSNSIPDHSNPASIHGYAMGDISKTSSHLPHDKIWVNSEFEQTHSPV